MGDSMALRLGVGLAISIVLLGFSAKRLWFLISLVRSGQPAVGRTAERKKRVTAEVTEVLGQKKLLAWT
ncbi:MAG: hypothetical protein RL355_111, partial [Actinomycetota bacterium]